MGHNDRTEQEKEKLLPFPHTEHVSTDKTNQYGTAPDEDRSDTLRAVSKTGRVYKSKSACFYIASALAILIVLAVITVLIFTAVYSQCVDSDYSNTAQLGCDNDTVSIGRLSSFLYSHVIIDECLKKNDYPHVGDIFVVKRKNLATHNENTVYKSISYDQLDPSPETGLVDYLYFLQGSKVEYTICLSSETTNEEKGRLFIFNNRANYLAYASNPDSTDNLKEAALTQILPIGANNESVCTTVYYNVTRPTYLFITSRTPGSINYNYSLSTYKVFYDHDDYKPVCLTGGGGPCSVKLPGGFFHPLDLQILAYIRVPAAADPFTTHLCMTPHISSTFAVVLLSGLFVACVLFLLVMCLTVFGVRSRVTRRRQKLWGRVYRNHNSMMIN